MRPTTRDTAARRRTPRSALLVALAAAGLLTTAPAALGGVQVGSSAWEWGNPQPQGNTLRATDFRGLTGYAVGNFGTLLKTVDGGTTWTGLPTGTFTDLLEVQAVDADTLVAGGGCVARRSDDGGATFSRIAFTPVENSCREPLAALSFPLERTGFLALADGTVLMTADGGTAFAQKSAVPGTRAPGGPDTPTALWFTSATTGFAATTGGKIFQTVDAANSWKLVSETNRAVRDIAFFDATTGYAVGDGGLFLRTTDGGTTWTPKDLGAPRIYTGVRCSTALQCVVSTQEGDVVVRTVDGGETATVLTPSTDKILAASFASPTRLVAAGQNGTTVVSDDAGTTFTPVGGRLAGTFSRLRAGLEQGTAFAPGADGALAKTLDGGKTWARANVATSEDVLDVAFPTRTTGYALDVQGGLYRTADGGATWRTLDTGTTARPGAVVAPDLDVVLLVGPTGVRRSTDGGVTFDTVRNTAVGRVGLYAAERAGSSIVAWGGQDVVLTTDKGRTWRALRKPGRYRKVRGRLVNRLGVAYVDFVDARTGFLQDVTMKLWRTTDGGRTWTELPGTGTNAFNGLSFSSRTTGFLVATRGFGDAGQGGILYRTTDGGRTFAPQIVAPDPIGGTGLVAPGGGIDYLLAGRSSLFATTKGGVAGSASTLTITTKQRRYTKRTRITVTGKLSPATGSERVTVSRRGEGRAFWTPTTVKVAANGAFTTSWTVERGANLFVAQWAGDFRSAGDGSPVLNVVVKPRRR